MRKPSKRTEAAAINELREHHSYLICELRRKDERSIMIASRRGGRLAVRVGIALKLVVPEDSALGREVLATRKKATRRKSKA